MNGKLVYVNSAFELILGYSNVEITEITLWSIIHPEDKNAVKKDATVAPLA
jgi:PAS domain S-box-containing protein